MQQSTIALLNSGPIFAAVVVLVQDSSPISNETNQNPVGKLNQQIKESNKKQNQESINQNKHQTLRSAVEEEERRWSSIEVAKRSWNEKKRHKERN